MKNIKGHFSGPSDPSNPSVTTGAVALAVRSALDPKGRL